jgi:lambda repressor-like predicted transcriptional regulator
MDAIIAWEAVKEVQERFGIHQGMKPCIAPLLLNSYGKKDRPDTNRATYIITVELKRMRFKEEKTLEILKLWNKASISPIQLSKLRNTARNVYKESYPFGCEIPADNIKFHPAELCIGQEDCKYYSPSKRKVLQKQKENVWLLQDTGWTEHLRSNSVLLYLILPYIEKQNGTYPGERIYVGYRDLSKYTGISINSIKTTLEQLQEYGLISFIPGLPEAYGRKATEIRRIFPLPRPPP